MRRIDRKTKTFRKKNQINCFKIDVFYLKNGLNSYLIINVGNDIRM